MRKLLYAFALGLFGVIGLATPILATHHHLSGVVVDAQDGALSYGTSGNTTYSIALTNAVQPKGIPGGNIILNITGWVPSLPGGIVFSFDAASYPENSASAILTIGTAPSTEAGTYTFTVTGTDDQGYHSGTGVLTIARAIVTANITVANKVYDGNTNALITGRILSGVIGNDDISLTGTAAFDDKRVGDGKTVTLTGAGLTGDDAANYSLASIPTTTANITPRQLGVTATGVNKVYDGATIATVTFSDDRVASDAITYDYSIASFADKNIGASKSVSVTGISISGADAGNYSLVDTTASTSANITARSLTVTATGVNKVYDRTATATAMLSDDRVLGDAIVGDYTSATFVDKNAAVDKPVTVNGISIAGIDAGNYSLSNTTALTSANITSRALNVVGITAGNKVYDGTPDATIDAGGAHLSGILSGDNVSVDTSAAAGSFADKNVGTNKPVTLTGAALVGPDASNYMLSSSPVTTANVSARAITISADAKSKSFGSSDPELTWQVTSGSLVGADAFSGALYRLAGEQPGTYPITQGTLSLGANYSIAYVGSTLTITSTATVPPGASPPSAGGGASGGGGSGSSVTLPGYTSLVPYTDYEGVFNLEATIWCASRDSHLNIARGVVGRDQSGNALKQVALLHSEETPAAPAGYEVIGSSHVVMPEGSAFSPMVSLTVTFDPSVLPPDIEVGSIYLARWDGSKWQSVETTISASNATAASGIGGYGVYALIGKVAVANPPPVLLSSPACFTLSEVVVSQSRVAPGETVTVSGKVENIGGTGGEYEADLKIDGKPESSKKLFIEAGLTGTVSFDVVRSALGYYRVDLNGSAASFNVEAAEGVSTYSPPAAQAAAANSDDRGSSLLATVIIIGGLVVSVGGYALFRRKRNTSTAY